jgi:hypothetical protein
MVVINEKNYFQRFRQVLGLEWQTEFGRPKGLKHYEEEDVWNWWNTWLEAQGCQPTARPGKTGSPHRYISYPLSQTMLRDGDRTRLAGWLWREARADISMRTFDRERLLGWMLAHRARLHLPRLCQILERPQDRLRFEATAQAVFDVYASIDWEEEPAEPLDGVARPVRRLTVGLYREEDPFIGEVRFSLYPRQPADPVESTLSVRLSGVTARLRPDRTGWFSPLSWGSSPPVSSLTMEVEGHPSIRELVFPEHDFWILVDDPLGPGGGACANWGPPMFERPFILLCRANLCHLLEHLRDLGVLDWRDVPVELLNGPWLEYRGCRISSSCWRVRISDLDASEEELLRAIRPRTRGTIQLNGGLQAPDRREGWMEDHLPAVSIQAARSAAQVTVTNLQSQISELCRGVTVGNDLELPALKPGYYRIEAVLLDGASDSVPGQALTPRILTVREWGSLQCAVVTAESTED